MFGKTIRRNVVAASLERVCGLLELGSSSCRTGCTVRTTNGRVTNISASTMATRVNARSTPIGDVGP